MYFISPSFHIRSGRDLLYLFMFIPSFLLLSLPSGKRYFRSFVWMDLVQVVFGACICYLLVFHALPFASMPHEGAGTAAMVHIFEKALLVIPIGALLHFAAAGSQEEKRLFGYFSIASASNGLLAILNSEVSLRYPDEVYTNILLYAGSGLCMAGLYLLPQGGTDKAVPSGYRPLASFINIGSPAISSITLMTLGLAVQPFHRQVGILAVSFAFIMFAARSTVFLRSFERAQASLETTRIKLENLSYTDQLTGVSNRRAFDQALITEWERGRRSGSPLTIILIDVDTFKQMNDSAGHQAGDSCLVSIAGALRSTLCRKLDIVARYGGDEFAAILPGTGAASARVLAEQLCASVRALAIPHPSTPSGHATISVGVGTCNQFVGGIPMALLSFADEAVYEAKDAGRNGWRSQVMPGTSVATIDSATPLYAFDTGTQGPLWSAQSFEPWKT